MFIEEVATHFSTEKVSFNGGIYSCQFVPLDDLQYKVLSGYNFSGYQLTRLADEKVFIAGDASKSTDFNGSFLNYSMKAIIADATVNISHKKVLGVGGDLGWLVEWPTVTSNCYVKYISTDVDGERSKANTIEVVLDKDVSVAEWDYLDFGSETYRVEKVFFNTGMMTALCVEEKDSRQNFIIEDIGSTSFSPVTMDYVSSTTSRNVSGYIVDGTDFPNWDKGSESTATICIASKDIGFTPKVGSYVKFGAVKREVVSYKFSYSDKVHLLEVK